MNTPRLVPKQSGFPDDEYWEIAARTQRAALRRKKILVGTLVGLSYVLVLLGGIAIGRGIL